VDWESLISHLPLTYRDPMVVAGDTCLGLSELLAMEALGLHDSCVHSRGLFGGGAARSVATSNIFTHSCESSN